MNAALQSSRQVRNNPVKVCVSFDVSANTIVLPLSVPSRRKRKWLSVNTPLCRPLSTASSAAYCKNSVSDKS